MYINMDINSSINSASISNQSSSLGSSHRGCSRRGEAPPPGSSQDPSRSCRNMENIGELDQCILGIQGFLCIVVYYSYTGSVLQLPNPSLAWPSRSTDASIAPHELNASTSTVERNYTIVTLVVPTSIKSSVYTPAVTPD